MIYALIFVIFWLIAEFALAPRLHITTRGKWLLWYGKKKRKYITLNKK